MNYFNSLTDCPICNSPLVSHGDHKGCASNKCSYEIKGNQDDLNLNYIEFSRYKNYSIDYDSCIDKTEIYEISIGYYDSFTSKKIISFSGKLIFDQSMKDVVDNLLILK